MAKLKKFSDEQIASLVKESTSYRDLCAKLGMMGGSSYPTVKKKVEDLNLDTSHFTGKAWNKGFTKETHPSLMKQGESYRKACHKSWLGRKHKLESREKASQNANTWITNPGRVKWYEVFNRLLGRETRVQGTWERDFAIWLNQCDIDWERPDKKNCFRWRHPKENHNRTYYPDFYLPQSNLYVEIKGYLNEKGRDKLLFVQEQNPQLRLVLLMEDELKALGILKVNKEGEKG